MKNTFGNNISVTLFGESHGSSVGVVLDGLPAGIKLSEDFIASKLKQRQPFKNLSTERNEKDSFHFESGVFNGFSTGTPICIIIPNTDAVSSDYEELRGIARPSHADYTAHVKYNGFEDYRGGGHFSGRVTAGLVAAGAIAISVLENKGIYIGTHISKLKGISDRGFLDVEKDIRDLNSKDFACLSDGISEKMQEAILNAKKDGDSIGGILETCVFGINKGIGEPWFDSVESMLSHAVFSIPAVKGIEFGLGFGFVDYFGSECNDEFIFSDGDIKTKSNNNGGINGGISNGMPIIFRTVIKPTPTISKPQNTVNFIENIETTVTLNGRHDAAIVNRARVVVDSVTALVLCDLLSQKYGTDWLAN